MQTYRVTFTLALTDGAAHPRKWVPDTIDQGLEKGEVADNWEFEEVPAENTPEVS